MSIFNELEIIHRGELTIRGDLVLPFIFHIKDIKDTSVNEKMMSTEYTRLLMCKKLKDTINNIAYYIDRELFLIDLEEVKELNNLNLNLNFYQDELIGTKYHLTDLEDVKKVLNALYLTENEIYDIQSYIIDMQNYLLERFLDILHRHMKNGEKSEVLTEGFMEIQICSEFGHSVIFKENLNKSMSDFSFRELQTKRAYLSRKYEVEKLQYERLKNEKK